MIKTIDVECNAANPNLPLKPMFAFVNSPSSIRVRNVPKRIGDWCIRKVYFTAVYPDSTVKTAECVLTGGVWVGTIEGTNTSGTSKNGYTIFADGTDENGNNVTGYVLGKGDIEILEADGTLSPDPARYTVKLLSAEAQQPREGDMYPTDDGYVIWQSGQANLLGTPFEQITSYVESAVSAKADLSAIPTTTSQLTNDSGFITSAEIEPYHSAMTPTENTGIANKAYSLTLIDPNGLKILDGNYIGTHTLTRDLKDEFAFGASIITYWPYNMTKYGEQTYNPALELKFCYDKLSYMSPRGPKSIYTGWMFRTGGAGFAIPCSEDATPDGTLYETTEVQANYVLVSSQTPHTIGFAVGGSDPYGQIILLDGEPNITANRQTHAKTNYVTSEVANKSDLPTKTSDLSNDSGFITAADIITKRDIMDMRARGVPQNTNAQSWFTIKYETTTENAWYYDEGRWESGNTTRVIAAPATIYTLQKLQDSQWTNIGEFQLDNNAEATVTYDGVTYSITGYVGEIVTSNQLISQIAALEARIAALEGN